MTILRIVAGGLTFAALAVCGDIDGRIVIKRQLTKKTLTPAVYNLRGATLPPAAISNEPVNEFERTVVFVEGAKTAPPPPRTVTIEQRNSRFEPDLVTIPAGSTVEFPNGDAIFHNVFSLSKSHPFDLGYYSKSQSRSVTFNSPGVVQVYCHIHSDMYAAIVITGNPWSARTSGGVFSFHNVPAGRYRLVAWHKVAGAHSVTVEVPETGAMHVTIGVPIEVDHP